MSYTIKYGDTLGEIAIEHNVSINQILAVNPSIKNASNISVGQRIIIPSSNDSTAGKSTYTIRYGDTLGEIAQKYGTSINSILALNSNVRDASNISVGQTISIPSSDSTMEFKTYRIVYGDSLGEIAQDHDVTVKQLLEANPKIRDASNIYVGQTLIIPIPFTVVEKIVNTITEMFVAETAPPENVNVNAIEAEVDDEIVIVNLSEDAVEESQFNRKVFFAGYRSEFGSLKQKQVEGLGSLLTSFEADAEITNIKHMAYMLSTIKHETANTYQPITEYGGKSYFNRYDPILADSSRRRSAAKRNGNTSQGDGYKFRGRGYVQITWKNNYKRLGDALGVDLVAHPEKALEPKIAYQILSYGMRKGAFTGKKLTSYINEHQTDYTGARRIINGTDKASTLKAYALDFERILFKASA